MERLEKKKEQAREVVGLKRLSFEGVRCILGVGENCRCEILRENKSNEVKRF